MLTPMEEKLTELLLTEKTTEQIARQLNYPKVHALRMAAWRLYGKLKLTGGRIELMAGEIRKLRNVTGK